MGDTLVHNEIFFYSSQGCRSFSGDRRRQNKVLTQPHTVKIKPKESFTCIDVSAGDEKQEHLKKELLPGGWHDHYRSVLSAGRFLTTFSLPAAASHHPTPPPAVTQPWYHPAACERLTPSIIHPDRVHVSVLCCSVLSCRAVHGQNMLK